MELQFQQQEGTFDRAQLAEMARELGISGETLAAAEKQWLAESEGRVEREATLADRKAFDRERWQGYRSHLTVFIIMNVFFVLMSIFTGGGWFIYPLLGWGLGLAFHTMAMRQTGEDYEREFAEWRAKRLASGDRPRLPGEH